MRELHLPLSEIRKMSVREVMGLMVLIDEHARIMKEKMDDARR